jgi:hypothetical protein
MKNVEIIKNNRYEVLVVDLKTGKAWVSPNLYFLALVLLRNTEVKQLAFVEKSDEKEQFAGMCSPQEILQTLSKPYPEYEVAANSMSFGDVGQFFNTLIQQWNNRQIQDGHKRWLTSVELNRFMKNSLHKEKIEYKDKLSLDNYKHIVSSENSYIALFSWK